MVGNILELPAQGNHAVLLRVESHPSLEHMACSAPIVAQVTASQ